MRRSPLLIALSPVLLPFTDTRRALSTNDAASLTGGGGQDVIILGRGFYGDVSGSHASGFCPEVDELIIGVRLKNWFVKEATRQTGRTSRDS